MGKLEECHLGFIKGGHKHKKKKNTMQLISVLISVFRYRLFEVA